MTWPVSSSRLLSPPTFRCGSARPAETAAGCAEEAVKALLEQRHVDDPGGGGGAAADGGGDDHLVAVLDGADAVPLGVHHGGAGHLVGVAVAVGAVQGDR